MCNQKKICVLCKQERIIRNSHIIPESFYKHINIYSNHKFYQITTDGKESDIRFKQKGVREYMLCDDCEKLLNDSYEKYAENLFFKNCQLENYVDHIELLNTDSNKIKLFILSVLYRASVSTLYFFKEVTLTPLQNEHLREMILNNNSGTFLDFGTLILIANEESSGIVKQTIFPPKIIQVNGHSLVIFFISKFIFIIFLSNLTDDFEMRNLLIGHSEKTIIMKADFIKLLESDFNILINNQSLKERIDKVIK
ncbi:MAG: hypothetical protein PF638_02775 [Candidatus Delongbacteria bacterium]|jgi:hypothetical protein|nr:hypothetical protein [Candidatus Delongbacteria bacterium]